jgi:hypothetical protein
LCSTYLEERKERRKDHAGRKEERNLKEGTKEHKGRNKGKRNTKEGITRT